MEPYLRVRVASEEVYGWIDWLDTSQPCAHQ